MSDYTDIDTEKYKKESYWNPSDETQENVVVDLWIYAATAMGGPIAGYVAKWFTYGGGARWLQEGIISLLPDGWRAQGVFDWESYVVDPITKPAKDAFWALGKATTELYRNILEGKGLIKPGDPIPSHLIWETFSKRIPTVNPGESLPLYILRIGEEQFKLGDRVNTFNTATGIGVTLMSAAQSTCPANKYFCVELQGISETPEESDKLGTIEQLANMTSWGRLEPYYKATALATSQIVKALKGIMPIPKIPTGVPQPTTHVFSDSYTGLARDAKARKILENVFESVTNSKPSIQELQIIQAIARFEGAYGESRAKNNWGGVQCPSAKPPCPSGCLEYTDKHLDGTSYQGCLRVYPTPEDGAKDLIRLVTIKRPTVWAAMKNGDCGKVASEMRQTSYHETAPSVYAKAIYTNAQTLASKIGEPLRVSMTATSEAKKTGKSLIPLGFAILGLIALKRRK